MSVPDRRAPDPGAARGLLELVEAATGPDREIDRALHAALDLDVDDVVHRGMLRNAYTGSLDAALALVDRCLPGWPWMVRGGWAKVWSPGGRPPGNDYDGSGATPALALCAALLKALCRPAPEAPDAR